MVYKLLSTNLICIGQSSDGMFYRVSKSLLRWYGQFENSINFSRRYEIKLPNRQCKNTPHLQSIPKNGSHLDLSHRVWSGSGFCEDGIGAAAWVCVAFEPTKQTPSACLH